MEEIVVLCLARAGLIKRAIIANDSLEGGIETLLKVVEDGISMVRAGAETRHKLLHYSLLIILVASKQGDPRLRLEKFLADIVSNLVRVGNVLLIHTSISLWPKRLISLRQSGLAQQHVTSLAMSHGRNIRMH